jgi:hypothetical protein
MEGSCRAAFDRVPKEERAADEKDEERRRQSPGRRRLAGGVRADLTSRRKDGLMDDPPRLRVLGGQADEEVEQLHPEVSEFVRWFTSWWLTRGLELVADEEAKERRAA